MTPRDDETAFRPHAAQANDPALLAARAATLRALHHAPEPLVLPNVWDAASARIVAEAGFPVVATTSSGVAACLGWDDGEQTPPTEMLAAIARIARVVSVPVTADLEGGYGLGAEEFAARLLATGAVGCNLEDTDRSGHGALRAPDAQAEYLAAVKRAGRAAGVDIVVNARIDVFVRQFGAPTERVAEAIRRARIYLEAGADCIYPIFVREEATIAALVEGIAGPVNILALPDGPSLARLGELGVARVSYAGRLHRAAFTEHRRCVEAIRSGAGI
ncbi:MAG TPA: isocitrate lyase/phosphoenolpyruvate mutase family protein [Thermomicrobiales bacterium]|jgi:2-methylisocitrate lyase-like PEP mutase family enzyme